MFYRLDVRGLGTRSKTRAQETATVEVTPAFAGAGVRVFVATEQADRNTYDVATSVTTGDKER